MTMKHLDFSIFNKDYRWLKNDDVFSYIESLLYIIKEQQKQIELQQETKDKQQDQINEQQKKIEELEEKVNKNSQNSSKPPSSDWYNKKSINTRKKSGKSRWGQKWHKGCTLLKTDNPDEVIISDIKVCSRCGKDISWNPLINKESRQVIDIPKIKIRTTEYVCGDKECPHCRSLNTSTFSEDISKSVQYGNNVKALSVYLHIYHMLPYERIKEFWEVFGLNISKWSINNFIKNGYNNLEEIEEKIKDSLINSGIIHVDETGIRVNKKISRIHVTCNDNYTYYSPNEKRGTEAMKAIGILENYKWKAVHDHLAAYKTFEDILHIFCNAHHLRELDWVVENEKKKWAKKMIELLLEILSMVWKALEEGNSKLSDEELLSNSNRYRNILSEGEKEYVSNDNNWKAGRKKRKKWHNLLIRLRKEEEGTLKFMYDFNVPFTNNLAERDLRMTKVKLKISWCFRSKTGSEHYCRIKSYISTIKKQGMDIFSSISSIFSKNIIQPSF